MNHRAAAVIAGDGDRIALAGDELYVDLDLSDTGLPAGSRLAIGDAVIELTAKPHRAGEKFAARFGASALRFVNARAGRELNLRGRSARVVVGGTVRAGDRVKRIAPEDSPGTPHRRSAEPIAAGEDPPL